MSSAFDPRIVKLTLQVAGESIALTGDLAITATGRKYWNDISAECECRIYNLTKEQQNNILTTASPLYKQGQPRSPINMMLEIGREFYGTFVLWQGYVFQCGMTQPPDIGIVLRGMTNNLLQSLILPMNEGQTSQLSTIAATVAKNNGLALDFQATNKQIENWSVSGSAQQQINRLGKIGGIDVCVNNGTLVVCDSVKARDGSNIIINGATGMVGIPQVTDLGVLVRVMASNAIKVGSGVTIQSELNRAANGTYKVIQLTFEIASRDQPFWYNLYCSNNALYQGTEG